MDFRDLSEKEKIKFAELMFQPVSSAQELRDWVMLYLGLDMPMGRIDDNASNSSPIEAMWEIYRAVKDNTGDEVGGYILLSARAAYKTLGVSIVETILMLHFSITIAHMAAIREQSHQSIQYINLFFTKIAPLLEVRGWVNKSKNKNQIEFLTEKQETVYIKIIVCSASGANSSHTNILCVAEGTKITVKNDNLKNNKRHRIMLAASEVFNLVSEGKKVSALTYNHSNGSLEFKPIAAVYEDKKDLLKIKTESGRILRVSNEHRLYTQDKGYVEAKDLKVGDSLFRFHKSSTYGKGVYHEQPEFYNPIITPENEYLEQVIIGSLLGDGGCYRKKGNNAYFAEQHSPKQKDYLLWKAEILSKEFRVRQNIGYSGYRDAHDMIRISTGNTEKLNKYSNFKKTFVDVEKLNSLGLAIWFMDDGSGGQNSLIINSQSFTKEQNELLSNILNKKFDLETEAAEYHKNGKIYWCIKGTARSLYKLYKICEPYWHPTMLYKFESIIKKQEYLCSVCGDKYIRSNTQYINSVICIKPDCYAIYNDFLHLDKIVDISPTKKWRTIDLTVEDNNNFFADGILVHNCIDEIDVIGNPLAYEEAKRIPTYTKGRHPITVKLSTRKYAFGMMAKEIENASVSGDKILKWNVLDIAEKCSVDRHKPELPRVDRYVNKKLPLRQISTEEYLFLDESARLEWDLVKDAYAGCATCPLLPVCKTRLAHRKNTDVGGLYRPISAIIGEFRTTNPDMAEAQLMCWKPSTKGLVYPRFETTLNTGNIISLEKAHEILFGDIKKKVNELDLLLAMKRLSTRFYCGIDWGYTHPYSIVVFALIPNGEIWIVDSYSASGLEFADQLEVAKIYRDKYSPEKWFCDQAMPSSIKSFNKNYMKCAKFTKDVMGGIEALRSKIVDGSGRRWLKVLNTESNKKVINAFVKHHFKLDGAGNPTLEPDDTPGVADQADAMRYVGQCLFPVKGPHKPSVAYPEEIVGQNSNPTAEQQMREEISKRLGEAEITISSGKKGGFHFSM